MRGHFKACYQCTRPWKRPGCHDHCKDYQDEKAAYEEDKEKERQRRYLENALRDAEYKRIDKSTRYYNMKK